MKESICKFPLKSKKTLSYRIFQKSENSDKVLVIHHGLSEHSGRYRILANFLDERIKIYALDARGNGNSDGKRAYVDTFDEYVSDLDDFVEFVQKEELEKDIYLLGHSMGSLVVTSYMKRKKDSLLKGLIISGFAGEVALNTINFKFKKAIAPFLSYFIPWLSLPSDMNFSYLTHDKKIIDDFRNDPLRNKFITARLGYEVLRTIKTIFQGLEKITVPIYIFHGKEDKITSYKGSKKLFEKVGSSKKKINIYDGLYHESFNESLEERKKVIQDLNNWLLEN